MQYIIENNTQNKKNTEEVLNKDTIEIKNEELSINNEKKNVSLDEIYTLKKDIINNSKGLTKIEYIQIFKIIYKNNIQYMENINGIFINLNNIDYKILKEIDMLIKYIKSKNKELDDKEKILKKLNINN